MCSSNVWNHFYVLKCGPTDFILQNCDIVYDSNRVRCDCSYVRLTVVFSFAVDIDKVYIDSGIYSLLYGLRRSDVQFVCWAIRIHFVKSQTKIPIKLYNQLPHTHIHKGTKLRSSEQLNSTQLRACRNHCSSHVILLTIIFSSVSLSRFSLNRICRNTNAKMASHPYLFRINQCQV